MIYYLIAASAVVMFASTLFFRSAGTKGMFRLSAAMVFVIGSIVISAAVPIIFSAISYFLKQIGFLSISWSYFFLAVFLTFVVYIFMLIGLTSLIIRIANDNRADMVISSVSGFIKNILEKFVDRARNIDKMGIETIKQEDGINIASEIAVASEESESAKSCDEAETENLKTPVEEAGMESAGVPACETEREGTKKPAEEAKTESAEASALQPEPELKEDGGNSGNVSCLNGFLDEAFKLKIRGDFEEAIAQYMHALDLKPSKDLLLWIVLDICTLYKELGRVEMSRKFLRDYADKYGCMIDTSVIQEIERNL